MSERIEEGAYLSDAVEQGDKPCEFCNETCRQMWESEDREYFGIYDPCPACPLTEHVTVAELEEGE